MNKLEGEKWAGTFDISPGRGIYGEISFAGPKTSLYLQDKEAFNPHNLPEGCLKGVSHDLTKLTLVHCIPTSGPGSANKGGERYSFATLFPHYVVYGDHYLSPNEKTIIGIHFVIEDATTLF